MSIYDITPKDSWEKEKDIVTSKLINKNLPIEFEKEYISKKGYRIPVSVKMYLHKNINNEVNGIWAIVKDMSLEKKANKKIKESEEKLKSLLENIPLGVYRSKADGTIISANQALIEMFGFNSLNELQDYPSVHFYVDKRNRDTLINNLKKKELLKDLKFS